MSMEEQRKRIGKRIAQLRKESGLTQQDLADKTGLLRNHISRIEQGKYSVGFDTLTKIGQAMDKEIDYVEPTR